MGHIVDILAVFERGVGYACGDDVCGWRARMWARMRAGMGGKGVARRWARMIFVWIEVVELL